MADLKTAGALNTPGTGTSNPSLSVASDDLSSQISTLRADLARLTDSVGALGGGAKRAVTEEASELTDKLRNKVREEPIMAIAVTAGIAYLLGLMHRS